MSSDVLVMCSWEYVGCIQLGALLLCPHIHCYVDHAHSKPYITCFCLYTIYVQPLAKKTNTQPLLGDNGKPLALTSHTLAPVPVAFGGAGCEGLQFRSDLPSAGLANITATYLTLMGFAAPEKYEPSLIEGSA